MKKTVVFDFDGVIHSYKSGWQGDEAVIPDEPVEGIKTAIKQIRNAGYEVVIVSTRCASLKGQAAVQMYLEKYEIEFDRICKEKPPAIVYIDDRAICFDGQSDKLLEQIESFKPWYQKEKQLRKKLFISVPMKNRTEENIRKSIDKMHRIAEIVFDEELDIIPSYIEDSPPANSKEAVWYLGESIKKLADADYFIGINYNYLYKGCNAERDIAYAYGIKSYCIDCDIFPDVFAEINNLCTPAKYDG